MKRGDRGRSLRERALRLLQRGLYEDHVKISGAESLALHRRVMERFSREPGTNLLRMIPGFLALLTIPLWSSLRGRFGSRIIRASGLSQKSSNILAGPRRRWPRCRSSTYRVDMLSSRRLASDADPAPTMHGTSDSGH